MKGQYNKHYSEQEETVRKQWEKYAQSVDR